MYKNQMETIEHLIEIVEKLENVTDSRMRLKIGVWRGEYYFGNGNYSMMTGELYLCLNYGNIFSVDGYDIKNGFPLENEFDVIDDDDYIKFNEDIFLNLNEWISKIYENKREVEEFHRKLNLELCALIKAL